jgi:hypothetical protein
LAIGGGTSAVSSVLNKTLSMVFFLANGETLAAEKHFEHGRKVNVSLSCMPGAGFRSAAG